MATILSSKPQPLPHEAGPHTKLVASILSTAAPSTPPTFTFTPFLRKNGHHLATIPVCPSLLAGHCPLGARKCPDRHPTPNVAHAPQQGHGSHYYNRHTDSHVCKHWLKALCKKGDNCEYLHEYDMRKMSECGFFNETGQCQNGDECLYLHVKEEQKRKPCENYQKGFCAKGPGCELRHTRRRLCPFYLAGFCPDGRDCKVGVHLKVKGPESTEEGKAKKARLGGSDKEEKEDALGPTVNGRVVPPEGVRDRGFDKRDGSGWRERKSGRGQGKWRNQKRNAG